MGVRRQSRSSVKRPDYPTCVRHQGPQKDVRLRNFFLCERCTTRWTKEAFDRNPPLWVSEVLRGFCQLCNRRKSVRLRVWFLCDICNRVAASIGRNHVAEDAIVEYWRDNIQTAYPYLVLEQNDKSALRPRRKGDVSGQGPLDFLVRDANTGNLILGIENKTGRSSIRDMRSFQLDLSDCDSIAHHVEQLGVPAYVIHAQVLEEWDPPTMRFKAMGLWWSDIYRMAESFRSTQMRKDERRGAAHFSKRAFDDMSTFRDSLMGLSGELRLVERFALEGLPSLYSTD